MVIVIAAVLALVAFVVLFRLLWLSAGPSAPGPRNRYTTVITLAAVALVVGLAVLAASGRLHWLAAVGAALLPFLRRGVGLLRYVPLLGSLLKSMRRPAGGGGRHQGRGRGPGATMTRDQALEILGLGTHPSREEILAAHRRLIQKLHPDRGGSTYLAQQLNEAKAKLLDEL